MKRCAVYTRKSTEEGLEQDFNSLQAQREACEAFIKSQTHEGWRLCKTAYDDGGYSGGSLERPALQQLLADIEARKLDVVVVYKVDRLTRSLADFAKIVERFDAQGVSFVSVTQQFNTTTSMGRLTLNVLLSFAQFEREVTAERIRDKIAASKQKGMWMGGPVPLGYDVRDRKLIVNAGEAEVVRRLFALYLELGTVRRLKEEALRLGLATKRRTTRSGLTVGGGPFERSSLYRLLSNPIYIGRLPHRGESYPGQHKAIVDTEIFEAAQAQLQTNAAPRSTKHNSTSPSLLAGLLFDETGDRLIPSHAVKKGRRYRYYISNRLMRDSGKHPDGWRLKAAEIEGTVCNILIDWLKDGVALERAFGQEALVKLFSSPRERTTLTETLLHGAFPAKRRLVQDIVARIELSDRAIAIHLKRDRLLRRLGCPAPTGEQAETHRIVRPLALKRRGVERKIVLCEGADSDGQADPQLQLLVAQAYRWNAMLVRGQASSVRALSKQVGVLEYEVSRVLPLAYLAPDIVEAILEGRQPIELTAQRLKRIGSLPRAWPAQRALLGFPTRAS